MKTLLCALAVVLLVLTPAICQAGGDCFAAGSYWRGFTDYWLGSLKKQNSMVLMVVGAGALGIFIITRGKWRK